MRLNRSSVRFTWIALSLLLLMQALSINSSTAATANRVDAQAEDSADIMTIFPDVADDFLPGAVHIGIANRGPGIARNVTLQFPVPDGARFDRIASVQPITCSLPGSFQTGQVTCSFGDLAVNGRVSVTVFLDFALTPPGTHISMGGVVSTDTADPNTTNNSFTRETVVAPFVTIDAVKSLKNPFRIEITGHGLVVPQFGGSGIGIGCDCALWPTELAHTQITGEVILEGGNQLKAKFPKGVPTQICFFDPFRERLIKTTFTR